MRTGCPVDKGGTLRDSIRTHAAETNAGLLACSGAPTGQFFPEASELHVTDFQLGMS
jgi:hypothetical protein